MSIIKAHRLHRINAASSYKRHTHSGLCVTVSACESETCIRRGTHWQHLANTTERFVRGGDADLCQITLTICYSASYCRGTEYCDKHARHCLSVCLSVCLSSSKSPKLHIRSFTKSLFTLSMAVARFCFGGITISYIGYFRAPKCANSYAKPKGSLGGTDLYLICSLNQSPAYAARPWTVHRTACLFTPQLSAVVNYAVW